MEQTTEISADLADRLCRAVAGDISSDDRRAFLSECRRRGIPVSRYNFSNIWIEGTDRIEASDWLLKEMREKAFSLLRREFGAVARFLVDNWTANFTKDQQSATLQLLEITRDKKIVWALRDWKNLGPASATQVLDDPGIPENSDLQR